MKKIVLFIVMIFFTKEFCLNTTILSECLLVAMKEIEIIEK